MESFKILERKPSLNWEYDEESNVLYISAGKPRPAIGTDISDGVVDRYDNKKKEVVGLTIIGFRARTLQNLSEKYGVYLVNLKMKSSAFLKVIAVVSALTMFCHFVDLFADKEPILVRGQNFEGVIFPSEPNQKKGWTPTIEDVFEAEKILSRFEQQGKLNGLRPLPEYKRQYSGVFGKSDGKVIRINALVPFSDLWKKEYVLVDDGGNAYFNVVVHLEKKTISDFYINALA